MMDTSGFLVVLGIALLYEILVSLRTGRRKQLLRQEKERIDRIALCPASEEETSSGSARRSLGALFTSPTGSLGSAPGLKREPQEMVTVQIFYQDGTSVRKTVAVNSPEYQVYRSFLPEA